MLGARGGNHCRGAEAQGVQLLLELGVIGENREKELIAKTLEGFNVFLETESLGVAIL